ncbi:MAG: 23S rRNA (uracil(1939)-C(5))-methyltransferase RlmD [Bacteroidetes bacterium]|nr:23S rRNA (uracil(1939)-C(5))-methyltransferase RlmD [Bacteroidota bacterium]
MRKRERRQPQIIENVEIIDAGAEGMAIAKPDQKVVFVPFGAPGDIVDLQVIKRKKNFFEGKILHVHQYSKERTEPACSHFGHCGGCKWQHMAYEYQLGYKQKQVKDNFDRIGKFPYPDLKPIIGSPEQFYYRNKLEFTFSNRRWFVDGKQTEDTDELNKNALGFHLPGMFDRILDIDKCFLQAEPSNKIRLAIKEFTQEKGYSYYDARNHDGLLRNLLIRNTIDGQVLIILVVSQEDERVENELLPFIADSFPEITSLMWVVNPKKNDQIFDLEIRLFKGVPYITEKMKAPATDQPELTFRIGPVSFYQTNAVQAEVLYKTAFDFAAFTGEELVYDLYTGTGTIANYIARSVKKVVGIEYVEEAIRDAESNAMLNGISNASFTAGDIAAVLNEDFVRLHGQPDVIITDPPRAGMHPKVVEQLVKIKAEKLVYVSCNPATQARDIALLSETYAVVAVQPVDMFPQTHHVENVVLLALRK